MKILINLQSPFYTIDQNGYCYDNMIELDWHLPFLPTENDIFDCDSIIDSKMPEFDTGLLSWSVDYIVYEKIKGEVTPILWLLGE
jgi:hypothetical protein